MGGYGSGRPSQRGKTSQYRTISVSAMAKAGALKPGTSAQWQWSEDGKAIASISTRAEAGRLILDYRYRENGGEWQPVSETVPITEVSCAYGGSRAYFLCQGIVNGRHCGRRVGKLYSSRYFVCRYCLRLSYPVQSEEAHYRQLRRANKRRATLGGEPGTCSHLSKPKGMHRRTYDRIVDEIYSAENGADNAFLGWAARRFPGLGKPDFQL
jgi:hypothetical protein